MKWSVITFVMMIVACRFAVAQAVPVEIMVGNEHYWYQHVIAKKFTSSSRAGFFHVSSLHVFFDRDRTDEIMSQSYLTYEVAPGVVAAVGTFYSTGPGLSPSFALQLSKKYRDFAFMLVPRVDLQKSGSYEAMSFVEYRPSLYRTIRLYSRVQAMSNLSGKDHNRSYQNFRVGLDIKKVQAGIALNVDEYGGERQTHHNIGFFLRTEL